MGNRDTFSTEDNRLGLTVRMAETYELPRVREIFEVVYKDTFSGTAPDFAAVTEGERVYVALLDDEIPGFATVWEPDAFIHFLFVDPAARRKHVGRAMVNALAEKYDRPLTLKCLAANANAVEFYRKTGWRELQAGSGDDGTYILFQYTEPRKSIGTHPSIIA